MDKKWKWLIRLCLVSLLVWFVLKYLLVLFLPLVLAFFITRSVYPGALGLRRMLRRVHIFAGPVLCRFVVLFLYLSVFIGALIGVAAGLVRQFRHFAAGLDQYMIWIYNIFDDICCRCDIFLGFAPGTAMEGLSDFFSGDNKAAIQEKLLSLPGTALPFLGVAGKAGVVFLFSVVFSVMALSNLERWYKHYRHFPYYSECHMILRELTGAGFAFVRTELIVICCIIALNVTVLMLLGNSYALLIGVLIAIIDALPVFGSGTVLFPWAVWKLFHGELWYAVILLCLYGGCQLIRQFLEPRLMGKRLHVEPAAMLASIFAGLQLFSIAGVILGPVGFLLIRALMRYE